MKAIRHFLLIVFLFILTKTGLSQNIGINTDGSSPQTGVMLDIKGVNAKSTTATQNIFQVKSNDAAFQLKLRLILGTNAASASLYGGIEAVDSTSGLLTYRHLVLQPNGGSVGIGTTSPGARLHVQRGSAGTQPAWTNKDVAIFENVAGTNATVEILTDNASKGGYAFANNTTRNAGGMFYQHSTNTLEFTTNGYSSGYVFIDNAGNVGINQSSPAAKLEVDGSSGSTIKIVDGNQGTNKVLTSDANGQGSWQALGSIGGSCFNNWELYTTSGASGMLGTSGASSTYTFTVPAGVTLIKVQVWGAGGGGGGGGGLGIDAGGGGGGGGGFAEGTFTVTPASTYTVTIGANGVGVAGANGTAGGTSSFVGSLINIQSTGGQGGSKPAVRAGGAGGVGSGGYLNTSLGNGGFGGQEDTGSATAGWPGTNGSGNGGAGGYGQAGYGGGGGGGGFGGGNGANNGNGMTAVSDTGAGGGGGSGGGGTKAGGDGADGKIIVAW